MSKFVKYNLDLQQRVNALKRQVEELRAHMVDGSPPRWYSDTQDGCICGEALDQAQTEFGRLAGERVPCPR